MNYPEGAEQDPRCPWLKDAEQEPIEVHVCATEVLHKSFKIETSGYSATPDLFGGYDLDYSNCSFVNDFKDCGEYTLEDLLKKLPKYLDIVFKNAERLGLKEEEKKEVKVLSQACEGWEQDEFEVVLE